MMTLVRGGMNMLDNNKTTLSISYDGIWEHREDNTYAYKGRVGGLLHVSKDIGYMELLDRLYKKYKVDELLFDLKLQVICQSRDFVQPPPSPIEDDDDVAGYINLCLTYGNSRYPLCVSPIPKEAPTVNVLDDGESAYHINEREDSFEYPINCAQSTPDIMVENWNVTCFPVNHQPPPMCPSTTTPVQVQQYDGYVSCFTNEGIDLNIPHFPSLTGLHYRAHVPDLNNTLVEDKVFGQMNRSKPSTWTQRHRCKGKESFTIPLFTTADLPVIAECGPSTTESMEELYIGKMFESKEDFRRALHLHALRNNFEFMTYKSNPELVIFKCVDKKKCKWHLRATQLDNSDMFKIVAFKNKHTCGTEVRQKDNRQATPWVVGHYVKERYTMKGPKYTAKHVMEDMQREFGFQMSYEKSWRCREKAIEYVRGKPADAYPKLRSFLYEVQKNNPGTIYDIVQEEDGRFKFCYMAIGACLQGFQFCRPVICVDGSHLKTRFLGHTLCAVALDADDHLVPLAVAIVDSENNYSWSFFMERLKDSIGPVEDLVFVSDRHPSIKFAVQLFFPQAHHRYCYQHIKTNVVTKFHHKECEHEMNAAAYAYRKSECDRHMQKVHEKDAGVAAYLRDIGLQKWCRSYFPGKRYDILTSNYTESFNKVTMEARKMPVTSLLEFVRFTLQHWFCERLELAEKSTSTLSPAMEENLHANGNRAMRFTPRAMNQFQFQIIDGTCGFTVDIGPAKRCDCGRFQLIGIPCEHALAAAKHRNVNPYSLCSNYYTTIFLKRVYAETIYLCDNEDEWDVLDPSSADMDITPPIIRSQNTTGNIRSNRILSDG